MPTLFTVGYGAWPVSVRARRLVEVLQVAGVGLLVDVRLCPCAADPVLGRPYGPRPWNLQAAGAGIVELLREAGIDYDWLVELGNPQRQDPAMTVLRGQLADPTGSWPVHRGLARLADHVATRDRGVAILCACAVAERCHRSLIADALSKRHFEGALTIHDLGRNHDRRDR